jgi:hypothetical protein
MDQAVVSWVKSFVGIDVTEPDADFGELRDTLRADIARIARADPARGEVLRSALEKAGDTDGPALLRLADEVTAWDKQAARAAASAAIPPGTVARIRDQLEASHTVWSHSVEIVRSEAQELVDLLRDEYPREAAKLQAAMDGYVTETTELLEAARDAAPDRMSDGVEALLAHAAELRKELLGDSWLDYVEDNSVPIRSTLLYGLAEIDKLGSAANS